MTEEINQLIGYLGQVSAFLSKIKFRLAETTENQRISEAVENYLDGFTRSILPMQEKEATQPHKENKEKDFGKKFEIFSNKEIKLMPKLKDFSYRFKKQDLVHEFRYRRNGIDKSFSSKSLKEAKEKAMEFCRQLNVQESFITDNNIPFNLFAEEYMKNVKQRNVCEKTFRNEFNRFTNHIMPAFKGVKLKEVRAPFIQRFLNKYIDDGLHRTAEALYYILKSVLDYAANADYIVKSPILAVKIPTHKREIGKALTVDAEKAFIKNIAGTNYELQYLVMLYTGCRPCELETVCFEREGFLTFRNRKQKNNVVAYKDIPITPMLAPYIDKLRAALPLHVPQRLGDYFPTFAPGYRLYDLRHTFATRCQTCGVPQEVVGRWLGHKSSRLTDNTYTHYPPEFMLEQAKKVVY